MHERRTSDVRARYQVPVELKKSKTSKWVLEERLPIYIAANDGLNVE